MKDYIDSTTFAGVSATPNIATRLYDRFGDFLRWATAWTYAGAPNTWSAQPDPSDPDGARPNDLYFH
ncbi:MAG: hypothetical protein NVS3B16_01770 [Vulcanimicrobiaceae bacterium]